MRIGTTSSVLLMLLTACPAPGGDSEGEGSSSDDDNGGCSEGGEPCGFLCCADGASCVDGRCRFPNHTAELYVYVCPSMAGCTPPSFFALDETCSPAEDIVPGQCVGTGLTVTSGQSYGFSICDSCGGDCQNPTSLPTPPNGFAGTRYMPGITLSCPGEKCEPPPSCVGAGEGASEEPEPDDTAGSPRAGDGTGGGGTGAVGGGGEATVCSESAHPTEFDLCVELPGCKACTIEVCSALYSDGSCCSGYRTSDTLRFWPCAEGMCSMSSELCLANAAEALRHCGCDAPAP